MGKEQSYKLYLTPPSPESILSMDLASTGPPSLSLPGMGEEARAGNLQVLLLLYCPLILLSLHPNPPLPFPNLHLYFPNLHLPSLILPLLSTNNPLPSPNLYLPSSIFLSIPLFFLSIPPIFLFLHSIFFLLHKYYIPNNSL